VINTYNSGVWYPDYSYSLPLFPVLTGSTNFLSAYPGTPTGIFKLVKYPQFLTPAVLTDNGTTLKLDWKTPSNSNNPYYPNNSNIVIIITRTCSNSLGFVFTPTAAQTLTITLSLVIDTPMPGKLIIKKTLMLVSNLI